MYLKRLEILGFKTFAQKTEIVFPPGVEPQPLEPFTATHDWTKTALTDQRPEPIVEPLEVTEIDTSNVVRLGRRDSEDELGPSGAA